MTLILKSNAIFNGPELATGYAAYKNRVIADGGEIISHDSLISALLFAKKQNIGEDIGFSITSAAWGIKRSGGNITKLYSLFNPDGDLAVTSGSFAYDVVDGNPSISSVGSTSNKLLSVGTTPSKELAIVTAAKTILANNSHYPASFHNTDALESTSNRSLSLLVSETTDIETLSAYANNNSGTVTVTPHPHVPWSGIGAIVNSDQQLRVYDAGQEVGADLSVTPHSWESSTLHVACGGGDRIFAGQVAETWGLVGATEAQVIAASERINILYA